MELRAFGKTGLKVSVLGFGGSEIGYQGVSQRTVENILGAALDAGVNLIDSAECYPGSEELIGKAVSHRRAEFHLFSKCGHGDSYNPSEWEPAALARSIDRSLKRLRTDHLDLIQLHSCSLAHLRKGGVIAAMQAAKKAGKSRFIGYSGDGDAARYAVESGAFDALQISVSIADQEAIERVLPAAIERGIGVIAKRPIANAIWGATRVSRDDYSRPYWDRLKELNYDFLKGNPAQSFATALRFTLAVPGVHTAIVGTTKPERIAENSKIVSAGPLAPREYDAIRRQWAKIAKRDWIGQE